MRTQTCPLFLTPGIRRCRITKVKSVSLHASRYAWPEHASGFLLFPSTPSFDELVSIRITLTLLGDWLLALFILIVTTALLAVDDF